MATGRCDNCGDWQTINEATGLCGNCQMEQAEWEMDLEAQIDEMVDEWYEENGR